MRREIEGVDLGFGQIVPPGNVALRLQFRESWKGIDNVLLPRPRHHRPQMRSHFIRSAAWVPRLSSCGIFVDPVEKVANLFSARIAPSGPRLPTATTCEGLSRILRVFVVLGCQSGGTLSRSIRVSSASLISNAAGDCSVVRSVPTGSASCAS